VIAGSYDYPCDTCTYTGNFSYFTNPFVVSASNNTVETALFVGNPVFYYAWDVTFNATSLTMTMAPAPLTNASFSPDPFNGPVFTVLSGNSFGSVIGIHPSLTCSPCAPITAYVSGDSLFINWQGAGANVGDTIELDFSVGGPVAGVPEPSIWLMMLSGFIGLGVLALARNRLFKRFISTRRTSAKFFPG
jgi:hypothetical protein